jgi:hypothetical protein
MKPPPTETAAQTDLRMRASLHVLVADQQAALAQGLPPGDRAGHEAALAAFPVWCVQREFGIHWSAAEQTVWQRVSELLLAGAQAQALGADLVALLRDPALEWDEAQEIDWVVRWWDAARLAGLPVDADFGECWRTFEWRCLLHDLSELGRICCARHRDGAPAPAPAPAELSRHLVQANRVALRYGPLKPLLRLLEPLSGARVQAGFTF